MRTTITIDDDLLVAVRSISQEKAESVGKIISDLAKRGLNIRATVRKKGTTDFPVFAVTRDAHPITLEDVKKLEDEV